MLPCARDFALRVKQSSFESCETQEDACRLPFVPFVGPVVSEMAIYRQPPIRDTNSMNLSRMAFISQPACHCHSLQIDRVTAAGDNGWQVRALASLRCPEPH